MEEGTQKKRKKEEGRRKGEVYGEEKEGGQGLGMKKGSMMLNERMRLQEGKMG